MTPDHLRAFMSRHDLTNQQLADKLDAARNTVSGWLNGKPIRLCYRLAMAAIDNNIKPMGDE